MNLGMAAAGIVVVACGAWLVGAAGGVMAANVAPPTRLAQANSPETIRLVGTLERGVECWIVRSDGGVLYSIGASQPAGLAAGDRVSLEGRPAGASFCMQGLPLRVERIDKAN
jgi:hypothetical protein